MRWPPVTLPASSAGRDCGGEPDHAHAVADGVDPRWALAETVPDLCDLTIGWLIGEIPNQPEYVGPVDVDEQEAPGLTAALRDLNRASFLTTSSQAGSNDPATGSVRWLQYAAVEGFAEPAALDHLAAAFTFSPYRITRTPAAIDGDGVPVTYRNGLVYTTFGSGGRRTVSHLAASGALCRRAVAALRGTENYVIFDPVPGRNTLWADLRAFLAAGEYFHPTTR